MTVRAVPLLLLLAACHAAPPAAPPAAAPVVPPAPSVVPLVRPPVPQVVQQFDRAHAAEVSTVFGPGVTAAQVDAISRAHRRAARALTELGLQGKHPTPAARAEADDAERALEDALAAAGSGL